MSYTHVTKVGRWTVKDGGTVPARTMKDGTQILSAGQLGKLELRAAITVFAEVELVSGAELKFARKAMALKQTDLAEHLGVGAETVSRWETDAEPFKRPVQLAVLHMLEEFQRRGKHRQADPIASRVRSCIAGRQFVEREGLDVSVTAPSLSLRAQHEARPSSRTPLSFHARG